MIESRNVWCNCMVSSANVEHSTSLRDARASHENMHGPKTRRPTHAEKQSKGLYFIAYSYSGEKYFIQFIQNRSHCRASMN